MGLLNAMPGAAAQGLIWGIMALGVYITYKILDLADLTVDGSMVTGMAVCAMLMVNGWNVWPAMLMAILAGMVCGLVTGIFHTLMGIPAILAGILTQLILWSVNLKIMGKANQPINANNYDLLISSRNVKAFSPENPIFVVGVFVVLIIALLYWFFGTELGSAIRATGANSNMSRAQGINTNRMKLVGLVLANGLVGLSGALYTQYLGSVTVNMGRGAIVIGLAAVIIGEVLFSKLFRNFALRMAGVVVGAIVYYVVIALVIQLGLNTDDLKLFSAAFVAIALFIPHWKSNHAGKALQKGGKHHA
jgi:putative ABC transport system permease protein